MNFLIRLFHKIMFDEPCICCGTYKNVEYWGYSDTAYCRPCAAEHGHNIFSNHVCRAKRILDGR